MNFVAIDFETATGYRNSACAVGIVSIEASRIVDEYYTLIKPPGNYYWHNNINVHGITPDDTINSPFFDNIFHEVSKRLIHTTIVAHNEAFDRSVLIETMNYYGLADNRIKLDSKWECTMNIYRKKGFKPYSLNACCKAMNIELTHHNALSDARAAAALYLCHDKL